jgi:DNA-binding transcriptional MerR regulator
MTKKSTSNTNDSAPSDTKESNSSRTNEDKPNSGENNGSSNEPTTALPIIPEDELLLRQEFVELANQNLELRKSNLISELREEFWSTFTDSINRLKLIISLTIFLLGILIAAFSGAGVSASIVRAALEERIDNAKDKATAAETLATESRKRVAEVDTEFKRLEEDFQRIKDYNNELETIVDRRINEIDSWLESNKIKTEAYSSQIELLEAKIEETGNQLELRTEYFTETIKTLSGLTSETLIRLDSLKTRIPDFSKLVRENPEIEIRQILDRIDIALPIILPKDENYIVSTNPVSIQIFEELNKKKLWTTAYKFWPDPILDTSYYLSYYNQYKYSEAYIVILTSKDEGPNLNRLISVIQELIVEKVSVNGNMIHVIQTKKIKKDRYIIFNFLKKAEIITSCKTHFETFFPDAEEKDYLF